MPSTVFFKRLAISGLVISSLALSACAPRIYTRGNLPREEALAKVKVGQHTRKQTAKILGSPSVTGTFDDKIWYYISRKTEKVAFFDETVVDQQVVAVYFDEKNVVEAIHRYYKDDQRLIALQERKTPTVGKEYSILDQLLGNLGRFGKQ